MDSVEKIIEISSELGSIQDFCQFVDHIHKITACNDEGCLIQLFLTNLKRVLFNEEFSYEKRRTFFTFICIKNIPVFNAMYKLQLKGKDNVCEFYSTIKLAHDFFSCNLENCQVKSICDSLEEYLSNSFRRSKRLLKKKMSV